MSRTAAKIAETIAKVIFIRAEGGAFIGRMSSLNLKSTF